MPTNIAIIFHKTMINADKITADGIYSYYKNLPFGKKNEFTMEVADALEMSYDNVRRKIARRMWKKYELKFVNGIINA